MNSSLLDALRRTLRWHRRSLAAVAAAVAAFCVVGALQPQDGAAVPVLVASRALAGGVAVAADDVRTVNMPGELVPEGAVADSAALVGRVLTAPLTIGSVLTEASMAGGQSLARPGFVVASLPLADAALAALVTPGSRIDIIGPTKGTTGVLASNVRVVAAPAAPEGGLGGLGDTTHLALVEVPPAVATELAKAASVGGVTVAVR